MKSKSVVATLALLALTGLAGCGSDGGNDVPQTPVNNDRTLTLNMANPSFLKSGALALDITGVSASSDGVNLKVPTVASGTLGLALTTADTPKTSLNVIPDAINGIFSAKLIAQNVPVGVYKIKAYSVGNSPAFRSYSTSINYSVVQ